MKKKMKPVVLVLAAALVFDFWNRAGAESLSWRGSRGNHKKQVRDNLDRLNRLMDTGGLPQSDLYNAKVQVTVSGETLGAAKNQIDKARR